MIHRVKQSNDRDDYFPPRKNKMDREHLSRFTGRTCAAPHHAVGPFSLLPCWAKLSPRCGEGGRSLKNQALIRPADRSSSPPLTKPRSWYEHPGNIPKPE